MDENVLVTGAGGFIGSHLVDLLKSKGYTVRGLDLKYPEFQPSTADEFLICDLRDKASAVYAFSDIDFVCALAADIGGMGHISKNEADILTNNALINLNSLRLAAQNHVKRYLNTSSACIYPTTLQDEPRCRPLREDEDFPADPQGAYGFEKLFSEQACRYYADQYQINMRIARLHNIYGPLGTFAGGREKAPAAICRKVAEADPCGELEIWGDGEQTRTFCYVADCVDGLYRLLRSDCDRPLNIGAQEVITINELARRVMHIAGKELSIRYVGGPQGVRGRSSNSELARQFLGWEPTTSLDVGLENTYRWIAKQVANSSRCGGINAE